MWRVWATSTPALVADNPKSVPTALPTVPPTKAPAGPAIADPATVPASDHEKSPTATATRVPTAFWYSLLESLPAFLSFRALTISQLTKPTLTAAPATAKTPLALVSREAARDVTFSRDFIPDLLANHTKLPHTVTANCPANCPATFTFIRTCCDLLRPRSYTTEQSVHSCL